jgi:hypothetical protein
MKAQMRIWLGLLILGGLSLAPPRAAGYYDPGTQRWINRDPVQENGGHNLSEFVANSPIDKYDGLGLQVAPIGGTVVVITTTTATGTTGGAGTVITMGGTAAGGAGAGAACAAAGTVIVGGVVLYILHCVPPAPVTYPSSGPINSPPSRITCDTKIIPFPGPTRKPQPEPEPSVPLPPGYERCNKTYDNNNPDPLQRICAFTCSGNIIIPKTGKQCDTDHIVRKLP